VGDWDEHTIPGTNVATIGPSWLARGPTDPAVSLPAQSPSPYPPPRAPAAPSSPPPPPFVPAAGATLGQALSGGEALGTASLGCSSPEAARRSPAHGADAGQSGTRAASDAAAEARAREARPAAPPSAPNGMRPFHLVWFDEARAAAARIPERAADERGTEGIWISPKDAPRSAGDPADEARKRACRWLGRGPFADVETLDALLLASIDENGEVRPAVTSLRGEIAICLCDMERLKSMIGVLEPLAPLDKRLEAAIAQAKDVVGRSLPSPEAVKAAVRRLLEAHASLGRSNNELEQSVDGALLRSRALQRRNVLGGEHARVMFWQGPRSIPAYLTVDAAALLPLAQRFRVSVAAELLPSQDESEPNPLCLRPIALGRVLGA
jgi:hypothetical protein